MRSSILYVEGACWSARRPTLGSIFLEGSMKYLSSSFVIFALRCKSQTGGHKL